MQVAITGSSSGIGAAVAERLKKEGHRITAFDLAEPKGNVDLWIKTDLNDPQSIDAAIAQSKGPYDVLINNAGVPPKKDAAEFVLNINFIGFRHFMYGMLDKLASGASIVNTASKAGSQWRDNIEVVKALLALKTSAQLPEFIATHNIDHVRAYNLSKEAVIALTMAETAEMSRRGMRMNSVSPAAVSTDILDDFVNAFGDKVKQNIQRVGRAGTADEVADLIVFLSKPESYWIRGTDVLIDGGMTAMALADALQLSSDTT